MVYGRDGFLHSKSHLCGVALTIDFGDNGTRRLGEDWVIKNCSVVAENAGQSEIKVAHSKR